MNYIKHIVFFICFTGIYHQGTYAQVPLIDTAKAASSFSMAIQQRSLGNIEEMVRMLQQTIAFNPQHEAAYQELAKIMLLRERSGDAAINAKKAGEINPKNAENWMILAEAYKQMQDYASLPAVYDKIIPLTTDNKSYYLDKGYALFLNKQYDASLEVYTLSENKFGPDAAILLAKQNVYLKKNQPEKAISEIKTYIEQAPNDEKGYILLSKLYVEQNQDKEAMQILLEGEKILPHNSYIALSKSDVFMAMGQEKRANDNLKKIFSDKNISIDDKIEILGRMFFNPSITQETLYTIEDLANMLTSKYPDNFNAHALYGDVLGQNKKIELAREEYLKAITIDSTQSKVWEDLLQIDLNLSLEDEAVKHANRAISLFPENAVIQFFSAYAFFIKQDYEKARTAFEASLDHADEKNTRLMANIYSGLGDTYHALKMPIESDYAYDQSLVINPDNTGVLNNYAYYLALREEKLDKAYIMAHKATELEPDNGTFEDTLAWVLFKSGKYDEALVWIKQAIAHTEGDSATLFEHYGDVLFKLGQHEAALTKWKEARDLANSAEAPNKKLNQKINEKKYID